MLKIFLKVLLGHIGLNIAAIDQDVIPRAILGWARLCDVLIPLIRPGKLGVYIDYDSTIIKQSMMY
jgi:hypothetical protein